MTTDKRLLAHPRASRSSTPMPPDIAVWIQSSHRPANVIYIPEPIAGTALYWAGIIASVFFSGLAVLEILRGNEPWQLVMLVPILLGPGAWLLWLVLCVHVERAAQAQGSRVLGVYVGPHGLLSVKEKYMWYVGRALVQEASYRAPTRSSTPSGSFLIYDLEGQPTSLQLALDREETMELDRWCKGGPMSASRRSLSP